MAFVCGSFKELLFHRTGINEIQMGDHKRMSMLSINEIYNDMMKQHQNVISQANAFQQMQGNQSNQGLLGQSGLGSLSQANPYVQEPIYPGKLIPLNSPNYLNSKLAKIAEGYGFEYDFPSDGWKNKKYGNVVSRRMIEDSRDIEKTFEYARAPNIAWLDQRIEEMRVKLC